MVMYSLGNHAVDLWYNYGNLSVALTDKFI